MPAQICAVITPGDVEMHVLTVAGCEGECVLARTAR